MCTHCTLGPPRRIATEDLRWRELTNIWPELPRYKLPFLLWRPSWPNARGALRPGIDDQCASFLVACFAGRFTALSKQGGRSWQAGASIAKRAGRHCIDGGPYTTLQIGRGRSTSSGRGLAGTLTTSRRRRFDTRIVLPSGTELITLPDAIRHLTVPKREHKHPRVLLAATALTDAAEGRTAQRLPRITLRASYRPHLNISSDCRHRRKCGRARPGPTDRTILECPPRQSSSRRGQY